MQSELLAAFLDLLETRSFTRTADRLGVTQSTVSARIATLEGLVGARLFQRSRAGTEITPDGLRFAPHARRLAHGWAEAVRAMQPTGTAARDVRIGIQADIVADRIGDWVQEFRARLPDIAFYIEPDYSNQMCADLARGSLDFAVLYTPHPLADLHFASIGEVRYRLVSTDTDARAGLTLARFVWAAYAPAFEAAHAEALPEMQAAPLASGQNAAVAGLLSRLGGSGYVLETSAEAMIAEGRFRLVADVPALTQPVYTAMHLRHRTGRLHQRLHRIVQRQFAAR